MKTIIPLLFAISIVLLRCGNSEDKTTEHQLQVIDSQTNKHTPSDSVLKESIAPDTTFQIQLNGKNFELTITNGDEPLSKNDFDPRAKLAIVDPEKKDTILKEYVEFLNFYNFSRTDPEYYWINFQNPGGSGCSGGLFRISYDGKIIFRKILNYNELSYWKINKTSDKLLCCQGFWNMDKGEAHFSEHLQQVSISEIEKDTVISTSLGWTKYAYDLYDSTAFNQLKEKEKILSKKINWGDYK